MADGKTIEAKLRVALEVAQTLAGLRELRAEAKATARDVAAAGRQTGGAAAATAAAADTDAVVAQVKRRSAAEREALAETKRVAKERADAEKAAAKERQRIADDDDKRLKKAKADADRKQRDDDAAAKKKTRFEAYQKRALAPQLTDITVGLATGQNPLTVALQQGGQLSDIYGGAGNAAKALMAVLTPMRLLVGGIAAGFALVASNIAAGYRESQQLNKSLALSGNVAGVSAGLINSEATAIAEHSQTSIGSVRDMLAQLVTVSGQNSTTLNSTGRAIAAMSKLTGESADETVKRFADQAGGITDWAMKANKAYNFLTADQVAYIRSLERTGRVSEAIKFTNEQLAGSLEQRSVPAIGALERGWNAVGNALSRVLDKLKAIGRDETPEERLVKLQERLRELLARKEGAQPSAPLDPSKSIVGQMLSQDKKRQDSLQQPAVRDEEVAQAQADVDAQQRRMGLDAIRAKEREIAQRAEQEKIRKASLEFRQLEATQSLAAEEAKLAITQAGLDREQDLVQRAYAKELISAEQQATELNAIERKRVDAELALARKRLSVEAGLDDARKNDEQKMQGNAQKSQLAAQITALESRREGVIADGKRLVDAEIARLDEVIRKRVAANAQATVSRDYSNPAQRAEAAARAATSDARKELEDLQRYQRAQQGPGNDALQAKLGAQIAEARKALDESTRKAQLDEVVRQTAESYDALSQLEQEFDRQVAQGVLTTAEGEAKKNEARAAALPLLRQLLELQHQLATGPAEGNAAAGAAARLQAVVDASKELETSLRKTGQSGFTQFLNDVSTGAKTAKEALADMVGGFAKALLNLINQRLAEKAFKFLEGLGTSGSSGSSGGGWLSAVGTWLASVKHTGGVIGQGASGMARAVSPLVFAGAQVLHGGGIVGSALRSNEVPVIAEQGEEMLTADNPRHINNFKQGGVNVSMSVSISGAGGAEADQRGAAADLQRMMTGVVDNWAAKQQRQGGILAKR